MRQLGPFALGLLLLACSDRNLDDFKPQGGDGGTLLGTHDGGLATQRDGSASSADRGSVQTLADGGGKGACGDGIVQSPEVCDAGSLLNSLLPDAPCRPDCTPPRCGDGVLDAAEQCDDRNAASGDGCSALCRLEAPSALSAQPPALHFGAVPSGCSTSAQETVLLHNGSARAVKLVNVRLVGCSSEFALAPRAYGEIAPGQAGPLAVTLGPKQPGQKSCVLEVEAGDGRLILPITASVVDPLNHTDVFHQPKQRKVDILLVLDASGSMMDEAARLKATAPILSAAANQHSDVDFHLGAVSMVKGAIAPGRLQGDPLFVTPTTPNLGREIEEHFAVSSDGGEEIPFAAMRAALEPPFTGTVDPLGCTACALPNICVMGGCRGSNYGFRRPDAALEVLLMTDEDDGSTVTADAILGFLRAQVNPLRGQGPRVHGLLTTGACGFDSQAKLRKLIGATGGETFDLCAADYAPAMRTLTSRMFAPQDQFTLTRVPDPTSVNATVDGKPVKWTYDAASNSVRLALPPGPGAAVHITYRTRCL
ncbi:MAG: DUF4215 domain-containing protein [Deltaproteobacteria bacterium]|nr:DUF4215 domain-containing protein [Deltaproteobacteria bacterium]